MNELNDRMHRLADAAADGVEIEHPAVAGERRGRVWWSPATAVAATAVVVTIAVGAALLMNDGDGSENTAAGTPEEAEPPSDGPMATVAVTFGEGSIGHLPVDLTLRFLDGEGNLIEERHWSETEEATPEDESEAFTMRGLVQDVPADAEVTLEATLQLPRGPVSCSQGFVATEGEQLILRLEEGFLGQDGIGNADADLIDIDCAATQSIDDWVGGQTNEAGEEYVGLPVAEAERKAEAAGLTTRVVGEDGMSLVITMDLRPDRLDLMVFDGEVVAAMLP